MGSYSIASGSYDGRARIYDVRTGKTTVDVLAQAVTSVRCSSDGNALLVSTLGGNIRMLDRMDGKLLNSFGREKGWKSQYSYRNSELRVRSAFAMGDAVVLSGSEEGGGDGGKGAAAFAWDVLKGEVIAAVPVGEKVKAVSCVAWNEGVGDWAAGCTDGKDFGVFEVWIFVLTVVLRYRQSLRMKVGLFPDVSDKAVMVGLVSRLVSTSSIAGFELLRATLFHRQNKDRVRGPVRTSDLCGCLATLQ
jgi:mitogen-activated protein kinase organizer 1